MLTTRNAMLMMCNRNGIGTRRAHRLCSPAGERCSLFGACSSRVSKCLHDRVQVNTYQCASTVTSAQPNASMCPLTSHGVRTSFAQPQKAVVTAVRSTLAISTLFGTRFLPSSLATSGSSSAVAATLQKTTMPAASLGPQPSSTRVVPLPHLRST